MSEEQAKAMPTLNDRQQAFIAFYLKNPNATNAARLAGYEGDELALGVTGHRLLRSAKVRDEIDRLRKERRMTPDAVLDMIEGTASVDLTPYLREDMTLDVQALGAAGLGYLVEGVKPGRNGTEIALASPQMARKMLARHHKLLGADVQVDASTTVSVDTEALAGLVDQLTAAQAQSDTEQDDTE